MTRTRAVGHDGVILHTNDGGDTEPAAYRHQGNELLVAAMERSVAAEPPSENAKKLLAEAKRYQDQGPDKPFLMSGSPMRRTDTPSAHTT
jgi:hypothetical protein